MVMLHTTSVVFANRQQKISTKTIAFLDATDDRGLHWPTTFVAVQIDFRSLQIDFRSLPLKPLV